MAFTVTRYRGGDGKTYEMHSQIGNANSANVASLVGNSTHLRRLLAATVSWSAAPTYSANQALGLISSAPITTTAFLDATDNKAYNRWSPKMQDAAVVAQVFTPGFDNHIDFSTGYVVVAAAGGVGITSEVRFFFEVIHALPI